MFAHIILVDRKNWPHVVAASAIVRSSKAKCNRLSERCWYLVSSLAGAGPSIDLGGMNADTDAFKIKSVISQTVSLHRTSSQGRYFCLHSISLLGLVLGIQSSRITYWKSDYPFSSIVYLILRRIIRLQLIRHVFNTFALFIRRIWKV